MKRRDLLLGTLAGSACGSAGWPAIAQPSPGRAAVTIGVDKSGSLPKLSAAASGALEVGQWLAGEGFDVKTLVDRSARVTVGLVKDTILPLVERGTLQQLVVYFAGHGFVSGTGSEFWLLSDAPSDIDAAITLAECRWLCRQFDIPNVVFISDACRSRVDSLGAGGMRGSVIFPGGGTSRRVTTEVDVFLATRVGSVAYEVSVERSVRSATGIYTRTLLDAFRQPCADMILEEDGKRTIPTRRLKDWLADEVPRRAQAARADLEQHPDAEVCSGDKAYIARATGNGVACGGTPRSPTIADVAFAALALPAHGTLPPLPSATVAAVARSSGFESAQAIVISSRGMPQLPELSSGFALVGARLRQAISRPGVGVRVLEAGSLGTQVQVDLRSRRAASVALVFADGSCTVLAALQQSIATVVVADGDLVNVSYEPSPQGGMRNVFESERKRLDALHASVAAAARFGVLRFEGTRQERVRAAAQLANRVRMLKGIDPTLGVYAAYAYAEADLPSQVESIREIMRSDLGVDLFDVAMLAGSLSGRAASQREDVVPFVPMMSQGWGLLRARDVRLNDRVVRVREMLRRSLWARYDESATDTLVSVLQSGQVL